MKTKHFFQHLSCLSLVALTMAFATTFIACGDKNDAEDPDNPVTPVSPVNPNDNMTVSISGGTVSKGDISITFPEGIFTEDTKVAVTEAKEIPIGKEFEASTFYQLTMPMSNKKPFTVKIKSDKAEGEVGIVVFTPGCITMFGDEVMPPTVLETTYSDGEYTATIPAFDKSGLKDNTSIIVGLGRLPSGKDVSARMATRANNSVVGKEGNVKWEVEIAYTYFESYSSKYQKLEAALPELNILIKEAIRDIHKLGFKVPDGTTFNYRISSFNLLHSGSLTDLYDKLILNLGSCYGCFFASRISRSFDAIYLKDELMLDETRIGMLKRTIIHETLHNIQSYYYPWAISPYPTGDFNAMFEMGSTWIEKFRNNNEPDGKYQRDEGGLTNVISNHFRIGLSRSESDTKAMYGNYSELGYATGPLLHYMLSKNYSRGHKDTDVLSLYDSHWGKIETDGYTLMDVLDAWYTSTFKERFFDGTDCINDYYLALWKGEVMSDFSIITLLDLPNVMNDDNLKFSLDGKVYPYGSEGLCIEMEKHSFEKTSLMDKELVVKQEAEGVKTYLLYSRFQEVYLFPKAATKGDSIVVPGKDIEALRLKQGFTTRFFLLTVREKGSMTDTGTIPTRTSAELRKAPSQILAVIVNGNLVCTSPTYSDGDETSINPYAAVQAVPNAIEVSYKGKKMHVVCHKVHEGEEKNEFVVESGTRLSFDIDDASAIESDKAKMNNLYVDGVFTFKAGGDIKFEEFYKFTVASELPMTTDDVGSGNPSKVAEMFGASYYKVWYINQPGGLTISPYDITRKDWVYKWDRDARKDVLERIDESVFTLTNNPSNEIKVIIFFKEPA